MKWKRLKIKKDDLNKLSKILVFVLVTALPFITITNTIGMDTFLDSFENSESYAFLKNSQWFTATDTTEQSYIIIQRTNHPEFEINKDDKVMYNNLNGEIYCKKIINIEQIGFFQKISLEEDKDDSSITIYENQIIGKIVKVVDENPWNTISLKLWSATIDNLNIHSLFK